MQKSIKKRPTIYLKSTKNQAKMDLLRGLGGLLEDPKGLLGRLEATLSAKLAPSSVWEASWGVLGSFLGRLEAKLRAKMVPSWIWDASWGGLGGLLGRLEAKLRAKMAPSWVSRGRFLESKN